MRSRETEVRVKTRVRGQIPEPRIKTESEPRIRAKGQSRGQRPNAKVKGQAEVRTRNQNQIFWSQGRQEQGWDSAGKREDWDRKKTRAEVSAAVGKCFEQPAPSAAAGLKSMSASPVSQLGTLANQVAQLGGQLHSSDCLGAKLAGKQDSCVPFLLTDSLCRLLIT